MTAINPTLSEWLKLLEERHPRAIELGLDRVEVVVEALDLQNPAKFTFVIAGTNGKGSCCAFLETALRADGKSVGCYTSPHLLRFNERIKIDGEEVSDDALCAVFDQVEQARGETSLSYFEFTTLAALALFDAASLDVLILEVGLGGRLDAVNVVDSDLAVITSIDLDHQDWLGDNRESIGYEKAGVMRPGRPVVYGQADMPNSVLQHAAQLGCTLLKRGDHFDVQLSGGAWDWTGCGVDNQPLQLRGLPLASILVDNAATAIQALFAGGFSLSQDALAEALLNVSILGRQQRFFVNEVEVILDVSHNLAAIARLSSSMESCNGSTWAVMSAMADKDIDGLILAMSTVVDHWIFADICGIERAATAKQLQQSAAGLGIASVEAKSSPALALQAAIYSDAKPQRVVVFGSFHTVADVLQSKLLVGDSGGIE